MKRITSILSALLVVLSLNFYISAQEKDNIRIVTAVKGLRMRQAPGSSGKVVTLIPFKETVTLLEEKDDSIDIAGKTGKWTRVTWKGKTGWVFGGFLDKVTYGDIPPEAEKEIMAHNIDIKEIYNKKFICNNPPESLTQVPAYLIIYKNRKIEITCPKFYGEAVIKGKIEIVSPSVPVIIKLISAKSKCEDKGQDYECTEDGGEIMIERDGDKYYVTTELSVCGKWSKLEFTISE